MWSAEEEEKVAGREQQMTGEVEEKEESEGSVEIGGGALVEEN